MSATKALASKVLGKPAKKKSNMPSIVKAVGLAAAPAVAAPAARKISQLVSAGAGGARQVVNAAETVNHVKDAVSERPTTLGKVGAVVSEVRKLGGDSGSKLKLSHILEAHTDVAVPRSVAYDQWTQFEEFPSVTKGAERVEQEKRDKVQWTAKIGPSRRSWSGEITEQVPDERISFRSSGRLDVKGVITFHSLDEELTRILVEIEYNPHGPVEHVGNLLRIQRRRVRRDLRLFKHFVELRQEATGNWRGHIAKKSGRDSGSGSNGDSGSGSNGDSGSGSGRAASRKAS